MKIVTVVGARPQFIKAATLSRVFSEKAGCQEILVHTGQHYDRDMSDVFFEQMGIPAPDYNLGVGGALHGAMTGRQLEKIEEVFIRERPDCVLVYGDTNSTLAGALAAAKLHIPIAHVEAGLRSFNRRMPEEINRVLTDHVSNLLFAPTEAALDNLLAEGIGREQIFVVGDVMRDAATFYKRIARRPEWFVELGIAAGDYILCTVHRADNTDDTQALRDILAGLGDGGRQVVMPLHPRTRSKIGDAGVHVPANVHLVPPVGYLEMTWLEMNCRAIATDSGGVQKEAYFHGKACITLRCETEWVELVQAGVNVLVGSSRKAIAEAIGSPPRVLAVEDLYGSGNAAEKIVDVLEARLGSSNGR